MVLLAEQKKELLRLAQGQLPNLGLHRIDVWLDNRLLRIVTEHLRFPLRNTANVPETFNALFNDLTVTLGFALNFCRFLFQLHIANRVD